MKRAPIESRDAKKARLELSYLKVCRQQRWDGGVVEVKARLVYFEIKVTRQRDQDRGGAMVNGVEWEKVERKKERPKENKSRCRGSCTDLHM